MKTTCQNFWRRTHFDASALPIGIVLGARKDELLMEYALEGITNQLFVARYQLYLPKREELQAQLDKLLDEAE